MQFYKIFQNKKFKDSIILFLLILISIIVYWSSLSNVQLFWDDDRFVFGNPTVFEAPHWYAFWIKNSDFYKTWPVSYLIFWALIKSHIAENVVFLKGLNIWLHSLNALLVFKILKKFKLPFPFFCVMFFLVHPLNVETVGWVFQFTGILALTFFLSSILCLLKFTINDKKVTILFSLLFFQLSLWSKSVAIPYVLVILTILYLKKKRIWIIIPFLIMGISSGIANRFGTDHFLNESKKSNLEMISKDHLLQRYNQEASFKTSKDMKPINQEGKEFFDYVFNKKKLKDEIQFSGFENFKTASWHYFIKFIAPYDQYFIYKANPQFMLSIAVIVVLVASVVMIIYFKLNFELLLLPVWYVSSVVLYMGFTYISFFYWSPVSDRYAYFLVVLMPFLVGAILIKWGNKLSIFLTSVYLCFYFFQNITYGRKFNNYIESYTDILNHKEHPQIYSNLIEQYLLKLDLKNADDTLKKAIGKFPDDPNLKDDVIRVQILRENLKN